MRLLWDYVPFGDIKAAEKDTIMLRWYLTVFQVCSYLIKSSCSCPHFSVSDSHDGTLLLFSSIAKHVGLDIENKLYETLGVCAKSKRVFPGLLAEQTTTVIQEALVKLLVSEGVPREKAQAAVVQSWKEGDTGHDKNVKSIHPDLRTLFKILKAEGIKVGSVYNILASIYIDVFI